jgi:tripartite-type tricarboxylate transporter receptor subunit TctC
MPTLFHSQAEFKAWFSTPLTAHVEGVAALDRALVGRLHTEAVAALQHPDVKGWMQRENSEPVGSSPAEAAAFLAAEVEKWSQVARATGMKPD